MFNLAFTKEIENVKILKKESFVRIGFPDNKDIVKCNVDIYTLSIISKAKCFFFTVSEEEQKVKIVVCIGTCSAKRKHRLITTNLGRNAEKDNLTLLNEIVFKFKFLFKERKHRKIERRSERV